MTNHEKNILHSCGLFAGIGEAETKKLLGCLHAQAVPFEKNEILWNMGDEIHSCALILSGSVRAETVDSSGRRVLMARHGAGALVGDVLMSTPGGKSPVYVIASEPGKLIYLPFRAIMDSCAQCCPAHTRLRENLISEIAGKFWTQRQRVRYLSSSHLRERIAMLLQDKMNESCSTTFSLGGTREDLADLLCVNRSALSRELGRMKQEGILDFYRDTFRVLQPDQL